MLDDETRKRCEMVQRAAEEKGFDLFEAMERVGLLVTADRRKMIQTAFVDHLLSQLDVQPDTALADLGGAQTVSGGIRGVKQFINLYAQSLT